MLVPYNYHILEDAMFLYTLLAFVVLPFAVVVAVLAGVGICTVWHSARQWQQEREMWQHVSSLTCKLWCGTIQGKIHAWSPSSGFGPDEEVIGVLVEPQPSPFVRISVIDDGQTSYPLLEEDRGSGILFVVDFGKSLQGLATQTITAQVTNTRIRKVMREFTWHRAPYQERQSPDPHILSILRARGASTFESH